MDRLKAAFRVNTHDLPHRAGELRQYKLHITEHEQVGFDILVVAEDEAIDIDLTLQAVSEGILATGQVQTYLTGQCTRCLDEIELEADENFTQLYRYEPDKKSHKHEKEIDLDGAEDELHLDGEIMDLTAPIRDALLVDLPMNPVCDPDCPGLCSECGVKWAELPEDHAHEQVDIRWAGLSGWTEPAGE